ncbi:MAG: DUF3576 domain-containing protein [Emcibacter sp.]|nr:DUF3576 domain-containing protein [Emcibacter sp.]
MTVYEIIKNMTGKSAKVVFLGIILTLGGCGIFGGGKDTVKNIEAAEEVYQIGVNAYLWRATLDTLSFMSMKSADHNGGVILTEWKVNPGNDKERTKVDIFIVGKKLSADSLNVTVHRQLSTSNGWTDEAPRPGASINIRNAILMQARLLRRNNAPIK